LKTKGGTHTTHKTRKKKKTSAARGGRRARKERFANTAEDKGWGGKMVWQKRGGPPWFKKRARTAQKRYRTGLSGKARKGKVGARHT